jgi:hypothetical protein
MSRTPLIGRRSPGASPKPHAGVFGVKKIFGGFAPEPPAKKGLRRPLRGASKNPAGQMPSWFLKSPPQGPPEALF